MHPRSLKELETLAITSLIPHYKPQVAQTIPTNNTNSKNPNIENEPITKHGIQGYKEILKIKSYYIHVRKI